MIQKKLYSCPNSRFSPNKADVPLVAVCHQSFLIPVLGHQDMSSHVPCTPVYSANPCMVVSRCHYDCTYMCKACGGSCYVTAGLYAKGTPKGGYPTQAMTGHPKAASVHDMDMTPSQPGAGPRAGLRAGATKGRSKAARNPTSAPGPYAQDWGAPGMPYMSMPGMCLPAPVITCMLAYS